MKMFIWKYENNELDSSYTQDKFNRFINDKKKALQIWEKVKDELSKQKKDKKFLSKKVNDKLFFFFTSKLSEEDILDIINSDIKVIKINNDMKTPYRYGGSSDNRQVKIGQEFYMAKYSKTLDNIVNKNDLTIHRQTAFMEYLACKILKLYKINVQEVEMGFDLDKNEYCVLCKDFTNHFQIIPLSSESSHNVREEANDINDLTGYLEIKLFDKYKIENKEVKVIENISSYKRICILNVLVLLELVLYTKQININLIFMALGPTIYLIFKCFDKYIGYMLEEELKEENNE